MKRKFTKIYLQECFVYKKGALFWRVRPAHHFDSTHRCNNWNARYAGKRAGWFHVPTQRHCIGLDYGFYKEHILIWVLHKGFWPLADIDHKDMDKANNKIGNLREATRSQNFANKTKQSNNKSGIKGVSWSKNARKWVAQCGGKYLGLFVSVDEAAAAYIIEAKRRFGEFARP